MTNQAKKRVSVQGALWECSRGASNCYYIDFCGTPVAVGKSESLAVLMLKRLLKSGAVVINESKEVQ